jgi:hypothetical protein
MKDALHFTVDRLDKDMTASENLSNLPLPRVIVGICISSAG